MCKSLKAVKWLGILLILATGIIHVTEVFAEFREVIDIKKNFVN